MRTSYILSALRTIFLFTFIAIPIIERDGGSNFITSDAFKVINLLIFSFSNGYVSTVNAIQAPQCVAENKREKTGIAVGLLIIIGISAGSLLAIPVGILIKG